MLGITGEHVGKLNDTDLRTLVMRLCEAELRKCGLPLSAVTAGGDQNAPDGGIDVRVDLADGSGCLDFIPKPHSGFQVKCSDMPSNKIVSEMRPNGHLRWSIRDLISLRGAYVIVSSQGSTTDSALGERKKTMQESVKDSLNSATIHLDFYDRDRLANWARNYPGVSLWLREAINEPLSSWRGYGAWAYRDTENSEYVLDEKARVTSRQLCTQTMTVEQGLNAMREILSRPGGVVRLIGLSGVGKTRLAQALFDKSVGTNALDSSLVAYTDQSHEPTPTPREMLQRIGASGLRTIFVVDNCNPATHRALVEIVRAHQGFSSLISIEYDVADDEPEETQVFELAPASEIVVEKVVRGLTAHISQTDRERIAVFSGGNARIALALASTVRSDESIGNLNETELFKRLFHQRQQSSESLMRAAEACSLVYSFDGESLEEGELAALAELADLSPRELFRQVSELQARDLIQQRSRWRAILPHAIANRLARQSLYRLPTTLISKTFQEKGRERLFTSFTRRLSYLHDCEPARIIAKDQFSSALANPADLDEQGLALFNNMAPIVPDVALETLAEAQMRSGGQFLSPQNPRSTTWATLLRKLAYDPKLFDGAAILLAQLAAGQPENNNLESARRSFSGLFHLYLSGTHASVQQRVTLIRRLFESENADLHLCAIEALDAMLEAWHFSSSHDFSFGAHSRDFGWEPRTEDDVTAWFRASVALARELSGVNSPYRQHARSMLARRFRALWREARIPDDIEATARELNGDSGWPDGWIAVRSTIRFDIGNMETELSGRLRSLEVELRPKDLVQKIRAYVLSRTHHLFDIIEAEGTDHKAASAQISNVVEELGREASVEPSLLSQLLPECLAQGPGQFWQFGRGLALGAKNMGAIWQQFRDVLSTLSENRRDVSLLQGFINGSFDRDPNFANRLLDEAINDLILGPHFPFLQVAITIDEKGVTRLNDSFAAALAPAWTYRVLSFGRAADVISEEDFAQIVNAIGNLTDGFPIAVDLLAMRIYSIKDRKLAVGKEILALGRELLVRGDYHGRDDSLDYHLSEIANACLDGDDGIDAASKVCANIARFLSDYRTSAWCYDALVRALFMRQPAAALNIFLGSQAKLSARVLSEFGGRDESPVNSASPEKLLAWANEDPSGRYHRLGEHIQLINKSAGSADQPVWSPLALHLMENAPNQADVLNAFAARLRPVIWSGTRADALMPYLRLVQQLSSHSSPVIRNWAKTQEELLTRQIEEDRQRIRRVDESFE